jgi:hypothetical protein
MPLKKPPIKSMPKHFTFTKKLRKQKINKKIPKELVKRGQALPKKTHPIRPSAGYKQAVPALARKQSTSQ